MLDLNLQYFAEEAAEGSADAAGEAQADATTATGTDQTADTQTAPEGETFESLIKGKYKKEFGDAVGKAVSKRFRHQQDLQSKLDTISPVIADIAAKYGIQPAQDGSYDLGALASAYQNDDDKLQQEAYDKGITVEQLKHEKDLERQNAILRQQAQQTEQDRKWNEIVSQVDSVKALYPDFDFESEMQSDEFARTVVFYQNSGMYPDALRRAYEGVHRDEILQGAMKMAAEKTKQQVTKSIQSGGRRPAENGASNGTAGDPGKLDPSKLTKAQIDDIVARAGRGERITFGG